jgi:hypothetical protein
MAIAVSAAVARFTGNPANGAALTSASFTPANNSLLVVSINADTSGTGAQAYSVSGGGLTWTNQRQHDSSEGGAVGGLAAIFTAPVVTGASMAVSVTRTAGSGGSNRVSVKVYVVSGADIAGTPVGATAEGDSGTNAINVGYTSTANNSRGIGCGTEWNELGLPTSTDTGDAADYGGELAVISAFKAADTPTAGTGVTINFDAAGAGGAAWNWVVIELLPAAGGATINADARVASRSFLRGASVVARVSAARISSRSALRGAPVVSRIARAVMAVRSSLRAAGTTGGLVFADARLACRSALRGAAVVARSGAARISARSFLRGLPLVARRGAARIAARTSLTARFFQDSTPITASITVTPLTRANVSVTPVTRATISTAPVTRAKITVSLGG